MKSALFFAALALASPVLSAPVLAASKPAEKPPTTQDGIFSEAQAKQGALTYTVHCAMCHGVALQGTLEVPALKGKFMANWGHAPVAALYDYIGNAMPQHAPGSLSAPDRAKLVAYLLAANGMPAGAADLPADPAQLAKITIAPTRRLTP
jgi:mono/diheme cytochrome c family protein